MSRRLESLLGQSSGAPEETRERHPDGSWRADALAKSRHARLVEHIQEPLDDCDPEKARRLCAEVCRDLLADLAPALLWVAAEERFRCQVLATWLRTLFDFANQTGIEGERLAALNRLEFTLEQSLTGEVVAQPAFVGMAIEDERRPWSRAALDELTAAARRRILRPRLETAEELEADAEQLAGAICAALSPTELDSSTVSLTAALLRLRSLLNLEQTLRRDRAPLPVEDLPRKDDPRRPLDRARLDTAIRAELTRLRPALEDPRATRAAPREHRFALRYLQLAGRLLADRIQALGWEAATSAPSLSLATRLRLLIRARFGC